MRKLFVDISISLDGFIAGPGISTDDPMGKGGEVLHDWIFSNKTDADAKVVSELVDTTGAVILGNRMYSVGIDTGWKGVSPFSSPAIVLCHKEPERKVNGFSYCTTGIHDSLQQARKMAGDKNIWVIGGANIIQQFLGAGLVDIIGVHIVPVLLNQGTSLFEEIENPLVHLTRTQVVETQGAVYMRYETR